MSNFVDFELNFKLWLVPQVGIGEEKYFNASILFFKLSLFWPLTNIRLGRKAFTGT